MQQLRGKIWPTLKDTFLNTFIFAYITYIAKNIIMRSPAKKKDSRLPHIDFGMAFASSKAGVAIFHDRMLIHWTKINDFNMKFVNHRDHYWFSSKRCGSHLHLWLCCAWSGKFMENNKTSDICIYRYPSKMHRISMVNGEQVNFCFYVTLLINYAYSDI